jgi:hypothetical protein
MIRYYLVFVAFLFIAIVVLTSISRLEGAVPGSEPLGSQMDKPDIMFSHKAHAEIGAACIDCHAAAGASMASSDLLGATHESCSSCHGEEVEQRCEFCHTDPADIKPVVGTDHDLIFSHAQHAELESVECQTCHTNAAEAVDLSGSLLPSMESCSTCHNDSKATNTCESCHTNFVTLIPADHERSDFRRAHRDFTRLGELQVSCQTCHTETFCQDCHFGPGLKQFGDDGLMSEPAHRRVIQDSPDQTILQNVHDLNYRFTHGIDAKARQSECMTCHEPQSFCAECHAAGGNINQAGFRPASHNVAGFTTIGLGSGGGLHAEEAKRDIESCISCHDVEGQDPTCMTCHTETGGIR